MLAQLHSHIGEYQVACAALQPVREVLERRLHDNTCHKCYRSVKSGFFRKRTVNVGCNDEICENYRYFHEQTFQK